MTREEILSVAKPILFNTDMVKAILDGRKSVTRRICKDANEYTVPDMSFHDADKRTYAVHNYADKEHTDKLSIVERICPICPGDHMYVRETWRIGAWNLDKQSIAVDYATGDCRREWVPVIEKDRFVKYVIQSEEDTVDAGLAEPTWKVGEAPTRWRPSIHMPKEAARIFLRVTDVRVERLHAMTLDDFLAEGVVIRPEAFNDPENAYWQARNIFSNIWDSTIPKKDRDKYGWDASPWVWVIQFERVEV